MLAHAACKRGNGWMGRAGEEVGHSLRKSSPHGFLLRRYRFCRTVNASPAAPSSLALRVVDLRNGGFGLSAITPPR